MSQRKRATEDAINLLHQVKYLLEKELEYDWSVTDTLTEVIESLEFDLGELEVAELIWPT